MIDYGRGTRPVFPFSITCATGLETSISDCFTEELDNDQCTHVAGVDCRGRYSNDSNTLMVTLVAAPCVTYRKTDCDECTVDDHYYYFFSPCYVYTSYGFCNCDTDCYESGDCCSDVSVAKKGCYGETQYIIIVILIIITLSLN